MFGTGLIVFRETLEAALFIGIIAAATKSLEGRTRWLVLGVALGAIGSLIIASVMERISNLASGLGQDLLNAIILSTALLMLSWHSIWVTAHAREMSEQARRIGTKVSQGTAALWAVTVAVAMTVLREGAETVFFVAGLVSGSTEGIASLVVGAMIGFALGVAVGFAIYRGLGYLNPRRLFSITNVLILLLAGNLASQLAKTLQQADWLSLLNNSAWDTTELLPNDSLLGLFMHGILGYDASPSQLQVLFYLLAITLISLGARHMKIQLKNTKS